MYLISLEAMTHLKYFEIAASFLEIILIYFLKSLAS